MSRLVGAGRHTTPEPDEYAGARVAGQPAGRVGSGRTSGTFRGMTIDTYAACPGGTGKKIKFCCSDLVGDLDQLDTLVAGDQTSVALDQVCRLAEKHPGRACLMSLQAKLELSTRQFGAAATTTQRFLDVCPDNPLALGQSAITEVVAGRFQEAAALFDRCREASR